MTKTKHNYIFNGRLEFNQNAEYEVHDPGGYIYNISKLLNKVYLADNNYIEFRIMDRCKIVFAELGRLKRNVNIENGLEGYFIDVYDLDSALFDNCSRLVEIAIVTNIDAIADEQGDIVYGQKQIAK